VLGDHCSVAGYACLGMPFEEQEERQPGKYAKLNHHYDVRDGNDHLVGHEENF